jgi:fatty-acyl-CoA synthase/long-chain acyl-CoA synthetase
MAKGLIRLGVRPGDHIATLMPNCADWVIAYFGGLMAGAVVVALNARYKRQELGHALKHSDCRVLLTTDLIADHVDFVPLIRASLEGLDDQTDAASLNLAGAPELKAVVLMGKGGQAPFLSTDGLIALGAEVSDAEVDAAAALDAAPDT